MLMRPQGVFFEYGFYFSKIDEIRALEALFSSAIKSGARYQGYCKIARGPGYRYRPFASYREFPNRQDESVTAEDLARLYQDDNVRVLQIGVFDLLGVSKQSPALITYEDISEEAVGNDVHPVGIWTAGHAEAYDTDELEDDLLSIARDKFSDLVNLTGPDYACFNVEWSIKCPYDLHINPEDGLFRTFFVSEGFLGERSIAAVMEAFPDAERKYVRDGVLIRNTKGEPETSPGELMVKRLIAQKRIGNC